MDEDEEIEKLNERIKGLCMEVYDSSGDEIVELIERANSFFTSGLFMTDQRDTISLCHFFIRRIMKDKKKLGKVEVKKRK